MTQVGSLPRAELLVNNAVRLTGDCIPYGPLPPHPCESALFIYPTKDRELVRNVACPDTPEL